MNEAKSTAADTPGAKVWVNAPPDADTAFLEKLVSVLGEAACRQLGIYQLPANFKLSVAIPVYNESNTIHEILRRVRAVPIPKEIVLVDDCSKDNTRDLLKEMAGQPDLKIYYHERNQGKGAAIRTAFEHCTGDVVLIQDADLEYDPAEYPLLLQPIIDGRADVVYGSRFIGNVARIHMFWHRLANGILTMMSNLFTNLNLTDMETCYKVFKREVLADFRIQQNRFGIEPELTAKIARRRKGRRPWRIYEVPISYAGRDYSEGKHIGIKDAFKAVYCIVRYWLFD